MASLEQPASDRSCLLGKLRGGASGTGWGNDPQLHTELQEIEGILAEVTKQEHFSFLGTLWDITKTPLGGVFIGYSI